MEDRIVIVGSGDMGKTVLAKMLSEGQDVVLVDVDNKFPKDEPIPYKNYHQNCVMSVETPEQIAERQSKVQCKRHNYIREVLPNAPKNQIHVQWKCKNCGKILN